MVSAARPVRRYRGLDPFGVCQGGRGSAMQVRDVMTKAVESVSAETDLVMAARKMKDLNVGSLPIVEGDRLIGILTDRDIVVRAVAEGRNPLETQTRSCLTPN